ncbi:hypothetical protein AAFF_G00007260 [Aldrovandia affinis]|uniref:Uncharacterized protein n=1 Tax=Aldrovandia affinis TaxID=143900 RepID=A0AAD7T6E7_9TELE|nr:hypothetical protein AAFF_G00007260 [Aldrovandia affinis]
MTTSGTTQAAEGEKGRLPLDRSALENDRDSRENGRQVIERSDKGHDGQLVRRPTAVGASTPGDPKAGGGLVVEVA